MSSKKCATCENSNAKIIKISKKKQEEEYDELMKILKTKRINIENIKKEKYQKKFNFKASVNLGKKMEGRLIYYFAALPKDEDKCNIILDYNKAYGDYSNYGITKVKKNGDIEFKLLCPQLYKREGNTYISHIHFLYSDKNNKSWNKNLKTLSVNCNVSEKLLKYVIKTDCALILNALPFEYYIKNRIPNSYPLPYDLVKNNKLSKEEVIKYIKELLVHSKKINNSVKNKKINLLDIPIILYCYDKKCNASHILQEKLVSYGFKNVRLYLPGIKGWKK